MLQHLKGSYFFDIVWAFLVCHKTSVFRPYSASSHLRTPFSSSTLTVSADSADQSLQYLSMSRHQWLLNSKYEELGPVTPTYVYEDSAGPSEGGWNVTGRFCKYFVD